MTVKTRKKKITNARDISDVVTAIMKTWDDIERDKEHFFVIGLDSKHAISFVDIVATGLLNEVVIHPREIFRRAIHHACLSIVVAHNHPSNETTPSQLDEDGTKRLKAVGELIGIQLLDHVIVTNDGKHYSFIDQRGYL